MNNQNKQIFIWIFIFILMIMTFNALQGNGVSGVNAIAKAQGLSLPALGYWSPEGHCFTKPAPGPCNGVFKE